MKILQINATYGYGSTGMIVRDISNLLQSSGDTPIVACSKTNSFDSLVKTFGNKLENNLHALMTRLDASQGFWSNASTRSLFKEIESIKPDILHIHNLHSNFINLPILSEYCLRTNTPLVVTLHDCWFFTGKCYHFADIGCENWKTGCGKCPKLRIEIPCLFDRSRKNLEKKKKIFEAVKNLHVVGCSRWITNLAKQSPIFENANFHTIMNGIDTNIFNAGLKENKSKFRILVMANKWYLPENECFREALVKNLDEDCEVKVIGCNEKQMSLPESSSKILKTGYIKDRLMLAKEYRKADMFLNMTFVDTLPTVNMEAICCGTPVVTYDSGGSPELIDEGTTGYVVDQRDIEATLKCMNLIRNNSINSNTCSYIGKNRFEKEKNYSKYIELYETILSE